MRLRLLIGQLTPGTVSRLPSRPSGLLNLTGLLLFISACSPYSQLASQIGAGQSPDLAVVHEVRDSGGIEQLDSRGDTLLMQAIASGNLQALEALLVAGADPERTGNSGSTPLAEAIEKDRPVKFVVLLLEHGADPDRPIVREGQTLYPLHLAAWKNNRAAAELLLSAGARRSRLNNGGERPAETAKRYGHLALARLLEPDPMEAHVFHHNSRRDSSRSSPPESDGPSITVARQFEANPEGGAALIYGSVQEANEIASFSVDGKELTLGSDGSFSFSRYVQRNSEKRFELVAIDSYGNRSTQTVSASRRKDAPVKSVHFAPLDPTQIPARTREAPTAALVIGIENYKRIPEAAHARSDAELFYDYAQRTLGLTRDRAILLTDADADNIGIQDAVRRLRAIVDTETDLYVYFAGHGFASGKGVPYLLPYDGDARFLEHLRSREELFASLAALGARSTTVFLDTCYSGRSREGSILAQGMRPLVIASSSQGVPPGFTVISAASADEFAGNLPEAKHGLFSYYLLRGLGGEGDLDTNREITAEELYQYVAKKVSRQAARLGREQTPELYGQRERLLTKY